MDSDLIKLVNRLQDTFSNLGEFTTKIMQLGFVLTGSRGRW
jgi:hypothetical protein